MEMIIYKILVMAYFSHKNCVKEINTCIEEKKQCIMLIVPRCATMFNSGYQCIFA